MQHIHDYVLIYARNKNELRLSRYLSKIAKFPYEDECGKYRTKRFQNVGAAATREQRPNLYYPIYVSSDGVMSLDRKSEDDIEVLPAKIHGVDGRWLWSKKKFEADKDHLRYIGKKIWRIEYEHECDIDSSNTTGAYPDWLYDDGDDTFFNKYGANELTNLGMQGMFSYSKPVPLIQWIIHLHSKKDAVILDFFAGSGTTAQAVEEANEDDNGHRKWIVCTNNENNICQSVTKPRIDTVLSGIRADGTKYSDGVTDSSYDYYTLGLTERQSVANTQTSIIENDDAMLSLVLMSRNIGHDKVDASMSDTELKTIISDNIDIVFINDACDSDSSLINQIHSACKDDGKIHELWVSSSDEPFNSDAIKALSEAGFDIHKKEELLTRKYIGKQEVL